MTAKITDILKKASEITPEDIDFWNKEYHVTGFVKEDWVLELRYQDDVVWNKIYDYIFGKKWIYGHIKDWFVDVTQNTKSKDTAITFVEKWIVFYIKKI